MPDEFALDQDDIDAAVAALSGDEPEPSGSDGANAPPAEPLAQSEHPAPENASSPPTPSPTPPPASGKETPLEPAQPAGFSLPPDAKPFAFKVDGRDFTLDGVVEAGDYIVIPRETWQRQLHPQIASRDAWQQERASWDQERTNFGAWQSQEAAQGKAFLEAIDGLMQQGPEAVAQWLADYERNLPVLKAEMQAKAAQSELQHYRQMEQQREEHAYVERMRPAVQQQLDSAVSQALQRPEFAILGMTPAATQQLKHDLWQMGEQLFWLADRDVPHMGIRAGQVLLRPDAFHAVLQQRASYAQQFARTAQAADAAAKKNAAAVAPTQGAPAKPKPSQPRNPAGQFEKSQDWAAFKRQLEDEDWTQDLVPSA